MTDNVIIGTGRVYFAPIDSDGAITGPERYVGDSTGAALSGGEGERLTIFAADGADRSKKLVDKLLDVNRSMSLTLRDMSLDNIRLFVGAESEATTTRATKVVDEEFLFELSEGDEIQLGSTADPAVSGGGYTGLGG